MVSRRRSDWANNTSRAAIFSARVIQRIFGAWGATSLLRPDTADSRHIFMTAHRLPTVAVPSLYRIELTASPKRSTFSGKVLIDLKLSSAMSHLELNGRGLKIQSAVFIRGSQRVKATAKIDKKNEAIRLVPIVKGNKASPLEKGKLQVEIAYSATLDKAMHGLYLAKDGKERQLVSQCEATDARAIFPCLDEPAFKAALEWTVKTDPNLVVVTNGALVSVKKRGPLVVHTFKRTRAVSTYLAAVTIGAYESTKTFKVGKTPCRILCGPQKLEQTRFAEAVTRYVLPWYEDYFAQPYHYQKLDQVAVAGFDAGAMENIGAIFYRQSRLLMRAGEASWSTEKDIAEVIAHEIAHQWFGNRVTMKWWDDLWLNEAFATWIGFKSVDTYKPEWRMWDDYQQEKEAALHADALQSTHPIYTPVQSPAEATELFDVITYSKGGSILRMAEQFLSPNVFRNGIRRYMDAYKDGNATGHDLWTKLTEASKQPVLDIMRRWTEQPGFPLVSVERLGGGRYRFSQRRFLADPGDKDEGALWPLPMILRFGRDHKVHEQRHLLTDRETVLDLGEVDWLWPNGGSVGFWRVSLDASSQAGLLTKGLADLSPAERMSLLEDCSALVRAGQRRITDLMPILKALCLDRDYVVTRAVSERIAWLDQRLVAEGTRPLLHQLVREWLRPELRVMGDSVQPHDESNADAVRRATLLALLGEVAGDHDTQKVCRRIQEVEQKNPSAVEPNVAQAAVRVAAVGGNKKDLDGYVAEFGRRLKARTSPELQSRYLQAFALFDQASEDVLQLCLNGVVPQESLRVVLAPMLGSRDTQRTAWAFLKKHWKQIGPRVGAMGISRLVEATSALPPELSEDVKAFFDANPVPEATRALKKAQEAMAIRKRLLASEQPALSVWLEAEVGHGS